MYNMYLHRQRGAGKGGRRVGKGATFRQEDASPSLRGPAAAPSQRARRKVQVMESGSECSAVQTAQSSSHCSPHVLVLAMQVFASAIWYRRALLSR